MFQTRFVPLLVSDSKKTVWGTNLVDGIFCGASSEKLIWKKNVRTNTNNIHFRDSRVLSNRPEQARVGQTCRRQSFRAIGVHEIWLFIFTAGAANSMYRVIAFPSIWPNSKPLTIKWFCQGLAWEREYKWLFFSSHERRS